MIEKKELTAEQVARIRQRSHQIETDQAPVKRMFNELADMYWISETDVESNNSSGRIRYNETAWDESDIRKTATTSSRDRVTGLHRMLRTSRPKFSVECENQGYADKIEKALDAWWRACNELKPSTLESELSLSAILFSDENLVVTAIDDLLADENLPKIRRRRLEDLRKLTPIRYEVESPLNAYPVMGDIGKSEHLSVTQISGRELRETYGAEGVEDTHTYKLKNYWDIQYHMVWYDSGVGQDETGYLIGGEHDLIDIPIFTTVADGTDLFFDENRKRQPFLYGMWKSGLHKREDEALTSLFSSMFARGSGPLVVVDSSDPNFDADKIKVVYQGLTRILVAPGRPQLADDKAFDANLLNALSFINSAGERATVFGQTLGEDIESNVPYSGYVAASTTGRLTIVPIKEATQKIIKDAATYALRYFKERVMEWEGLKANEILDDFELTVSLEVDLPQDKVRTAQFLAQLKQAGVPLSNEWIHNELQIKDSRQMTFDVMTEMAAQAAYQQDLPQVIQQLSQMFAPKPPPQQMPGGPGGQMPPQGPPQGPPPEYPAGQGAEMAQAGGEITAATEPIPPEQAGNNGRA